MYSVYVVDDDNVMSKELMEIGTIVIRRSNSIVSTSDHVRVQ